MAFKTDSGWQCKQTDLQLVSGHLKMLTPWQEPAPCPFPTPQHSQDWSYNCGARWADQGPGRGWGGVA